MPMENPACAFAKEVCITLLQSMLAQANPILAAFANKINLVQNKLDSLDPEADSGAIATLSGVKAGMEHDYNTFKEFFDNEHAVLGTFWYAQDCSPGGGYDGGMAEGYYYRTAGLAYMTNSFAVTYMNNMQRLQATGIPV